MQRRYGRHLALVFFCSLGWVYAGPAFGDDGGLPENGATSVKPADQDRSLFAEDAEPDIPAGQNVSVGTFGQIDLHVKDLELSKVLQLLSIQSQRNIVVSRNVAANISADLYGVDFYEALDAVLHTNGFGYREKGNFIYVYTRQELDEMEKATRRPATRIVRLNYLSASDASAFVSPLLSAVGSIAVSGDVEDSMQPTVSNAGRNTFAHPDTLIIRDYEENIAEIAEIIKQLDVRPRQVLVEATILQARLNEATGYGVDFAIFTDMGIGDFSAPLNAVRELISGQPPAPSGASRNSGTATTSTVGNVLNGRGGLKVGVVSNDAAIFIRALDEVTDTTVLATPKLLVLNRQRADLLVGERLGYLSTTATDTSSTQTVEFLDVGTQLTLRPFISDDDFIRLELRPSVSDGQTEVISGMVIPNQTTQELTTNVIVRNAQTVVLGGLFKEDNVRNRNQVPGAGNIPILGAAFQGRDDTHSRSEVIFLIRPMIMKDEALTLAAERAMDGIQLQVAGARQGLLPWARSKLTASHVRDAMGHLKDGNKERALWSTNMALSLDPGMREALRLREEITGQKVYYGERSILNEVISEMIDQQMGQPQSKQPQPQPQPQEQAEETTAQESTADVAVVETGDRELVAPQPELWSAQPQAEWADLEEGVAPIDDSQPQAWEAETAATYSSAEAVSESQQESSSDEVNVLDWIHTSLGGSGEESELSPVADVPVDSVE